MPGFRIRMCRRSGHSSGCHASARADDVCGKGSRRKGDPGLEPEGTRGARRLTQKSVYRMEQGTHDSTAVYGRRLSNRC